MKQKKTICSLFIAATITLDTHTRTKDIQLISDLDESTCLLVPKFNPIQLVTEITIKVLSESVQNHNVIIQIQMVSGGHCKNIMFMNSTRSTCGQNAKTEGEIGQLIATIPDNTSCYYQIPVECEGSSCAMHGYLSIRNNATEQIKICGIQQG